MSAIDKIEEKKVYTENKDFPLATIREMVAERDIIPDPDYQRDFIYDDKRKSLLVESVLLGIPIPTIYLCQEEDETYSVIDGQQRIMTFTSFQENKFKLKGLVELPELNGKFYADLDKPLQKKIKTSTLHAVTLLKQSQELKYEIFARLNQGAVALKPQELRNCIYRGTFNRMLEDIAAKNPYLPELFASPNYRKAYQERILRFFALKDYAGYKSSMPKTLNAYMAAHQNDDEKSIKEQKDLFNGTIDIIKQILGKNAFRVYSREKAEYIDKFSPSVYDSIIIPFSSFPKHSLMAKADSIRAKIESIRKTDDEYLGFAERSTSSRTAVVGRILKIYTAINDCLSGEEISEKRAFSPDIKELLFHEGYVCSYCGNVILSIDDAEVDHIVPFSLGGKTDIDNAQLLHRHCNREKSDSFDGDWADGEDDEA